MKRLLTIPLLLASAAAVAQPYVTVGYGFNSASHDKIRTFRDGTVLRPNSSSGVAMVAVGYKLTDKFGLEVSYSQFEQDASRSSLPTLDAATNTIQTTEWETALRAKQFAIKPTLFFPLHDKFLLKGSLGLSYNHYETSARHFIENDTLLGHEFDTPVETIPTEKQGTVGVIAGAGAYLKLYQGLSVGVEANYNYDRLVRSTQVFGTLNYQF